MAVMATLGLLGGTSWESTVLYYQHINTQVRKRVGGFHSAPLLLNSVDFADVELWARNGQWTEVGRRFGDAAKALVAAGAQAIMLCTNTLHIAAEHIERAAGVPFIHIVDATADKIKEQGLRKVILLGTRYTMENDFFKDRLQSYGIEAVVPDPAGRDEVHRVVFEELVQGVVKADSRAAYAEIVKQLAQNENAYGLIMGCTEIGMLITEEDVQMPTFDTMKIHAEKAVEWAIANGNSAKTH